MRLPLVFRFRRRRLCAALLLVAIAPALGEPLDAEPGSSAAREPAPASAPAPAPAAAPRPAIRNYRIDDWQALSNEALVIRTNDGRRYRATLMGRCIGLKFTDTIAFVTRGERSVDRFAGIMLPDGSRCYFKTFELIPPAPDGREAGGR